MKAALVNAFNTVENVIVWDDTCVCPDGLIAIVLEDDAVVSIGWVHNPDDTFTDPNPPPPELPMPEITLSDLQIQLAAIQAQIDAMANK